MSSVGFVDVSNKPETQIKPVPTFEAKASSDLFFPFLWFEMLCECRLTITGFKNCHPQSIGSTGVRLSMGETAGNVTGKVVVDVKMESVANNSHLRSAKAWRSYRYQQHTNWDHSKFSCRLCGTVSCHETIWIHRQREFTPLHSKIKHHLSIFKLK